MFKEKQREEIIIISSFSRFFFQDKHQNNSRQSMKTIQIKQRKWHIFTHTNNFKQFEIFFFFSFRHQGSKTKTIDKIIFFFRVQRIIRHLVWRRSKKTKVQHFFFLYICKKNKRKKKMNEWTIAHSSNLLDNLTHAKKHKRKHIIDTTWPARELFYWRGITETVHKFAYMEAIRNKFLIYLREEHHPLIKK